MSTEEKQGAPITLRGIIDVRHAAWTCSDVMRSPETYFSDVGDLLDLVRELEQRNRELEQIAAEKNERKKFLERVADDTRQAFHCERNRCADLERERDEWKEKAEKLEKCAVADTFSAVFGTSPGPSVEERIGWLEHKHEEHNRSLKVDQDRLDDLTARVTKLESGAEDDEEAALHMLGMHRDLTARVEKLAQEFDSHRDCNRISGLVNESAHERLESRLSSIEERLSNEITIADRVRRLEGFEQSVLDRLK